MLYMQRCICVPVEIYAVRWPVIVPKYVALFRDSTTRQYDFASAQSLANTGKIKNQGSQRLCAPRRGRRELGECLS